MAMKKKIENAANSLADELLANSGVVPATVPQNGGGNKTEAQKEGFTIREVVEKFFRNGIGSYEGKHGVVKVRNRKKQNIDDVL